MGPRVPTNWTVQSKAGFLYVRDTAVIRSQVQELRLAIPVKPSWTVYCEESSLIMAGLIHDKMYNPRSNPPVTWEHVPVFLAKRNSNSEASASTSKCAKLEALEKMNAPSLTPTTSPTKVLSLNDELSISAQEAVEAKKKMSALTVASVRPLKAIIPLLTKSGASAKKGKESSLDCYTARYMKASCTLPNGSSIQVGHFWNKRMEVFHAVQPLLSSEEGRKHPSSDPMDAFALFSLYMIKVCFHLSLLVMSTENSLYVVSNDT
ncbi:hypothetical protein LIER_26368 [Lithospermum erythrorhizon]|uniref:Uncharacterized protein n=1 Tax=Lithospermum erythrorhizon TaxID=34254 RepID=A0AAV3R842_LITER